MQNFTVGKNIYQKNHDDMLNTLIQASHISHDKYKYKLTWRNYQSKP